MKAGTNGIQRASGSSALDSVAAHLVVEDPCDDLTDLEVVAGVGLDGRCRRACVAEVGATLEHIAEAAQPSLHVGGAKINPAFRRPGVNLFRLVEGYLCGVAHELGDIDAWTAKQCDTVRRENRDTDRRCCLGDSRSIQTLREAFGHRLRRQLAVQNGLQRAEGMLEQLGFEQQLGEFRRTKAAKSHARDTALSLCSLEVIDGRGAKQTRLVGWVEDTLDVFLEKNNPKINFVHFDMDTYSSTKFTLKKIKPYLTKNAILIFDEFTGYIGWENGEYKAFKEVFKEEEFTYLAFSMRDGYDKCVVQIK